MRRRLYISLAYLAVVALIAPGPLLSTPETTLSATGAGHPASVAEWVGESYERVIAWLSSMMPHFPTGRSGTMAATTGESSSEDEDDILQTTGCELETCGELGPQVDPDG